MNFERERNCFYHLKNNISDEAKTEFERGVGDLIQIYNTTIYENRFLVGGVVEVFTLALMRSTGIEIEPCGDVGVGGDLILPTEEMFSVKGCFTERREVTLINTRDASNTPWTTATLFVLSGIGIVYGDPSMVGEDDLKRTQDGLKIKDVTVNRLAIEPTNRISMSIPFKPSTEEAIYSKKMSDAVALQIMNESELKILSDQVLSDLTDASTPNDDKQLTLNISQIP